MENALYKYLFIIIIYLLLYSEFDEPISARLQRYPLF